MIITILTIVGGVWSCNKGWVRGKQVRNVAGTASALHRANTNFRQVLLEIGPK